MRKNGVVNRIVVEKRIVAALFVAVALPAHVAVAAVQPNILFIAIDDLNNYITPLDHHPGVITPNFERLARRSVTFTNAHCAAPACHPSRVAVLTGVHPTRSGIYRNAFRAHGPRWRHESPMLENAVVLSQHFRDHGYRAVGGGKIFHTLQWTPGDSQNDPDAWDAYRGDPLDPISADWPRSELPADQNEGFVGTRPLNNHYFGAAPITEHAEESYGDHLIVDWAEEQMHTARDQPLFLAVGLFRPHIPWEVPQRWFDLYPLDDVHLPVHRADDLTDAHRHGREPWHKWVTENDQWHHLMRGYLASISYVDNQLGRLLDALDASPISNNTIVVLWTDHGFHIGEKENWEKFALWDQTTNVPLFIHAPGVSQDGQQTGQPATLTDIYPTLCELAGLPVPEQCTGESLVPQIKDPTAVRSTLALTSYQFSGEPTASHAVADDRYRLIHYGNGFEELYDLKTDPNEFTNRINDSALASVRDRLRQHLPKQSAEQVEIPTDSPYHRGRRGDRSRWLANRPLEIAFKATPKAGQPDGVLVSHGGNFHGYAVYVQEGTLRFAVRRNKKLTEIVAQQRPPSMSFSVKAILAPDGAMTLSLNNEVVAQGNAGGLITSNPNEGALIGTDEESSVGNYATPFPYRGQVSDVRVNGPANTEKK